MVHPDRFRALSLCVALITAAACGEKSPAPGGVCTTRFEPVRYRPMFCGCRGVNLIVIVDMGSTMGPAQERLATGLYDLMGYLINPDPEDPEQDYRGIEFLHMGFFSANLTVQETDDPSGEIQAELLTDTDCTTKDLSYGLSPDDAPEVGDVAACMARRGVDDVETNRTLAVLAQLFDQDGFQYGMDWRWDITAIIVVSDREERSSVIPDEIVAAVDARADNPIFAAFVGVPNGEDSPCEGTGEDIREAACLEADSMQLNSEMPEVPDAGVPQDPAPACTSEVTGDAPGPISAVPGRRFAETAQAFGDRGLVSSVCNADFSPTMKQLAAKIGRKVWENCWPRKEPWTLLPKADRDKMGCPTCGMADVDQTIAYNRAGDEMDDESCPASLYAHLDEQTREMYLSRKSVEREERGGRLYQTTVICPYPKLATPLDCVEAERYAREHYHSLPGWYYCETPGENHGDACYDRVDNDGDGFVDCDDNDCQEFKHCGGAEETWHNICARQIRTMHTARIGRGYWNGMESLRPYIHPDANCREAGAAACNDGEDNDGNGRWDCEDTSRNLSQTLPHHADPACCPMSVDADGRCVVDHDIVESTCGESNWRNIGACLFHQAMLKCR